MLDELTLCKIQHNLCTSPSLPRECDYSLSAKCFENLYSNANDNDYQDSGSKVLFKDLTSVAFVSSVVSYTADGDLEVLHSLLVLLGIQKSITDTDICTSVVAVVLDNCEPRLIGFLVVAVVVEVCCLCYDLAESSALENGDAVLTGIENIKHIVVAFDSSCASECAQLLACAAHNEHQVSKLVILENSAVSKIQNVHLTVGSDVDIGKSGLLGVDGVVSGRDITEGNIICCDSGKNVLTLGVELLYSIGLDIGGLGNGVDEAVVVDIKI